MSFISVFDVMGPNMIGPSSSHTAGAARIALLARKLLTGSLKKVEFTPLWIFCQNLSRSWDRPCSSRRYYGICHR